ncbi:ABC-2 type transport system permease protein [Asanoa ferruginea]|uniref:ABC-2 type transport system permease protein n=1 Tax=Asanoa ferruginea TaxID=53367 RepID=A0A3D9ZFK3_9ACTN|nr:ABC transporter permease [Asanoa ferruginea]REF95619.1 ABC-2 type transport system permease protein [Asanoa ferruginea]GIF51981.1 exporter of polyketide antibiotics [Asanoa ferruginea]
MTGTWHLFRFALRRDRVVLPLWTILLGLFPGLVASSFASLYPDPAELAKFAASMSNPSLTAVYGPIWAPNLGGLTAWRSSIVLLIVALATAFTVIRHTRAEEEQGRRELLGATVIGREAGLAAAMLVALLASVVVGGLTALGTAAAGAGGPGAVALGLQYFLACLLFGAIAAVVAQITQGARTARWIAGAVLIGSLLLRMLGDAGGDLNSPLSWISPIGFLQRLRPFADERWWVAGVVLLVVLVLSALAYRLNAVRDLDAGLIASRPGPARAPRTLLSPLGLAWRLQRSTLFGWLIGYAVLGLFLGSATNAAADAVKDSPELADAIARIGSGTSIGDMVIATGMAIIGIGAAAQGVQAALRARSEESALRVEPLLAASVGRLRWAGGHLLFAFFGPALGLLVAGLFLGIGYGAGSGEGAGAIGRVVAAGAAQLPAVWFTVAIVVLLFGLLPRMTSLGWAVLAFFLLLGQLGAILQLSQWALDLSPFTHLPALPGGEVTATPLVWLVALAALLTAAGLAGFRRRDIASGG